MLFADLSEIVAPDIYRIKDTQIFWGYDLNTNYYFIADKDKDVVISGGFDNFEETESSAIEYWNTYV